MDEVVIIRDVMQQLIKMKFESYEIVDTKDLYNSLTTKRNSVDRSIRAYVNCIPFIFETELDVMGWIKGTFNPSDVGTKPKSSLKDAVVLMFATGTPQLDYHLVKPN